MEMNLRHYLIDWLNERGYGALDELAEHDIRVARDERFPNLFNLKYGSILADKSSPLVRACRGAVVELVENDGDHCPYYRLVAYAFDRFFNLGESNAAEIDWASATVYEKYDGSLIKLFWNGIQWVVSTSGSVGGASNVGGSEKSFEELFWDTFRYMRYNAFDLNPFYCYVFELCAPENRIVVKYEEPMLRLLAVRDRKNDFSELPLKAFSRMFWVAESYDFGAEELAEIANSRGADHEGFIVCDAHGNRIKVKSDVYCQLHRVRGNGEPDFSELFLNDDLEEFLLHFPEYRDQFEFHLAKIETMEILALTMVSSYSHLDQKSFAQVILKESRELSGAMFALRSGKVNSFGEWLEGLTPKKLDVLLGIA